MEFKVGNVVRIVGAYREGEIGIVSRIDLQEFADRKGNQRVAEIKFNNDTQRYCYEYLQLINQGNNMASMTLVQKMKLALKSEPEKTFQKVGITDEKDELTAEGTVLFHNWLFEKSKAAFNTEVAQPLLAEQEKESK